LASADESRLFPGPLDELEEAEHVVSEDVPEGNPASGGYPSEEALTLRT
jgi:hypothetical protein